MPIPLFNSVASWFLKKRINQIELFKKYPNEVQQEVLRKLLVYNINTEFGEKYDFKSIKIQLNRTGFKKGIKSLEPFLRLSWSF